MSIEKAAFLGPQAENQEILEELINDVLKDYIYWRRNIHPEDLPSITERDKFDDTFLQKNSELKQELFTILSELKKGAPTFSKRYFGHLLSDLYISSVVGYFGAMLYNQNNVVAEVSPVTSVKELEYMSEISKMLSYPQMDIDKLSSSPSESSWGHLSSGGTSANLEALWVARNVKFYPLAIRLLAKNEEFKELGNIEITLPNEQKAKIMELSAFDLLSLSQENILELNNIIFRDFDEKRKKKFEEKIPTLQKLGITNFYNECEQANLKFKLPKVIIPHTVHYCWYKSMDILGLGNDNLVKIPVDMDFKIRIDLLNDEVKKSLKNNNPVLAVIGICGTTEEGAVDQLSEISRIRGDQKKNNFSYWLHSDAAIGGYFASLLKDENFGDIEIEKFTDIKALGDFDSIVIDPHKLGYVPYPAGAIIFKDSRMREHITYEAPYLKEKEDVRQTFLGQWTLEGSRPGAAAISCYLAQHTVPLNNTGYGSILNECLNITNELLDSFETVNADENLNKGFQIVSLYEPQLNILCYTVASKFIKTPDDLNKLNEGIYNRLSVTGDIHANKYEYIVSKTEYPVDKYAEFIKKHLNKCGIEMDVAENFKLFALRSVLMNPLVNDKKVLNNFAVHLCNLAYELLPNIQIERMMKLLGNRRLRILVAEDNQKQSNSLKYNLEIDQTISRGIEVYSISDTNQRFECNPDVIISDIDFNGDTSKGLEFIDKHKDEKILVYSAFLELETINKSLNESHIPYEHCISKSSDSKKDCRNILNAIMTSFIN